MFYNFLKIIILLCCLPSNAFAHERLNIVASIPPIASLVKMIGQDLVDVEIIQKTAACPHHLHLKPSEAFAIKNADYFVYIDDNFETSMVKYIKNSHATKIKTSEFKDLRLENHNFHIWLDLHNAKIILDNVKQILLKAGLPSHILEANYKQALAKLKNIVPLPNNANTLIIGESLYYLLQSSQNFFEIKHAAGLKKLLELKAHINQNKFHCIIYDENIKNNFLHGVNTKKIELDIENWGVLKPDLEDFYIEYISKIYEQARSCM